MSSADVPLRIGIVAHSGLGGSGTVATDLAVGLNERGHQVHIITPQHPFRLERHSGVRVHELAVAQDPMWATPPWSLALASRIAVVTREQQLDVLHAHFALPYAAATALANQILGAASRPWVTTLHGSDVVPLGIDPNYAPVVRHTLQCADRVTVPSRYLRDLADSELKAGVTIDVVPNFVDTARFCPAAARPLPSTHGATFFHASNFRKVKRVSDVVAIFARVASQSNARLLLVGDGPERRSALAQLEAQGLMSRVDAPGAHTNVEAFLAKAHVALLPSERESFGLAALEAQAAAVPVIASDVGGLPEVVRHNHTGFLAQVGDIDAMAAAALSLATDDKRWQAMAEASRAHAIERFSPERALDDYTAIYRSVLALRTRRRARDEASAKTTATHDS